jgi:dynein heavy chain
MQVSFIFIFNPNFILADSVYWKDLMASEDPSRLSLPSKYEDTLTEFQKLMIRKIIKEENLMLYVKEFIRKELSDEFIESPAFDLPSVYVDSIAVSPIIFILSPGADPIPNLQLLAKQRGMEDRLKILSLGQGQGMIAQRFIENGQANGDWVCLQNCHLSSSWMPELERIQESQNEDTINPEYRLWLTSIPTPVFPVPVLQSGIKLTNEPPRGLKANLKRTFLEIDDSEYESCSKPREYKKLLFALAYFHAVILERRKFGAIGWNISYEWMNSDFFISQAQLKMFLDQQPEVPYTALNYLCAEINYGGRVTDDKDIELIKSLLKRYFCPDILRDEYKLSLLDTYYAPKEGNLTSTLEYIKTLPLEDDPEIFGLHPNANITYKKKTAREFLDMLITIQPRVAASGGTVVTPEEIVSGESAKMLAQVPEILDRKRAHSQSFIITDSGALESLGVFLGQEIDRFNILLKVMKKTLFDLGEAIKGTVVMSIELEHMFNSIIDKKVPLIWEDVAYPSLKPLGSWMEDLIERIAFMDEWLYNGPPISYYLSAFFFPQGFMTASLQTYSRKNQIAIDTLKFKTNVRKEFIKDIKEAPEYGVNIHGLYLQGAKWNANEGKVADSNKDVLFVGLPVIWLEPILETAKDDERAYQCPLYKTSLRKGELSTTGHSTNFIMYLALHTEQKPEFWVNRGVALLCQLDD